MFDFKIQTLKKRKHYSVVYDVVHVAHSFRRSQNIRAKITLT